MKALHISFVFIMFSHWFGWGISLIYMLVLVMMLFFIKLSSGLIRIEKTIIYITLFNLIFIVLNIYFILTSSNISSIYSYMFQYLSLFIVVMIILFSGRWEVKEFHKIAYFIFWVAFFTIFIEFVMVNYVGISKDIMPAVRYSPSYYGDYLGWHRPFGLTGQSSANGGILLLSYLLLIELEIVNKKSKIALLIGIVMTISGQAIISTAIILSILKIKDKRGPFKIFLVMFFLLSGFLLLKLDIYQKVSFDYIYYVLLDKAYVVENLNILNGWQMLFGTLGTVNVSAEHGTEVYIIEFIKLFGIIFTISFWLFVWFLVRKSRLKFIWFISCFITSLHYPTILYIEAQLPIALLYLYTSRNSKRFFLGGTITSYNMGNNTTTPLTFNKAG